MTRTQEVTMQMVLLNVNFMDSSGGLKRGRHQAIGVKKELQEGMYL